MVTDWVIVNLEEFIFNDDLRQELNAVAVDFQVVHTYDGDDVVDNFATEAYLGDEVFAVGMNPVFK